MKHKSKLLIGLSIILLGLALNKWAIENFVPVENIESLSFNIQILFVQLLFIVCGIYLITNKRILKIIILALLVPSLVLSIINPSC